MATTQQKDKAAPAQSARCDCYNGHNSTSGRCNCRHVTDPTRHRGEMAVCERCRADDAGPDDWDGQCPVCGLEAGACVCPECPVCGAAGDPTCYEQHGLAFPPPVPEPHP